MAWILAMLRLILEHGDPTHQPSGRGISFQLVHQCYTDYAPRNLSAPSTSETGEKTRLTKLQSTYTKSQLTSPWTREIIKQNLNRAFFPPTRPHQVRDLLDAACRKLIFLDYKLLIFLKRAINLLVNKKC
jgi:hypothetical protein